MLQPAIELPQKLQFLFEPHRYKVLHGGRGGAKSWGIARTLLIKGSMSQLRIPCCREIQKSISDSVHALLKTQAEQMGLSSFYKITDTYLEGRNGTLFTFHGLKHNVANIKSLEGADICWVEEGQAVTKASWEVLIPTIRKPNSEIWVSFNPELETDETYQRFVLKPPTGAKIVKVDWRDNPWFPEVLRQEMTDLKQRDPDAWLNVWEGHCRLTLDGAVFAKEMRQATEEGRFTRVPYNPSLPVHCFWDLGRADLTAIWFAQSVGFEFRLIDYYENQGYALNHYLQVLSKKPYQWGQMYLPHDAENELLASDLTIAQQLRKSDYKVSIVPKLGISEGIEAARAVFPKCYFDQDKCADGIKALQHYRYDIDPKTNQWDKKPLHDWASHGADAFRYFAVSMRPQREKKKVRDMAGGWLG